MPEISPPLTPDALPSTKRIAVLVIHGIGQQQPYETLDQFTRGLLNSFRSDPNAPNWKIYPQLEICKDPSHTQQSWVRASYRIKPDTPVVFQSDSHTAGDSIEDISLFEYYWAPITQDKITYIGSLLFLIRAGLQPFLYLGANLNAIGTTERGKLFKVVVREFVRQTFFFLPLILFLAATLAWLANLQPVAALKAFHDPAPTTILTAVVIFIRYLYLFTTGKALFQSIKATTGWQAGAAWRITMSLAFIANIFLWPIWLSPILNGLANGLAAIGISMGHVLPILPPYLSHWSAALRSVAAHTAIPPGSGFSRRLLSLVYLDPCFSSYAAVLVWLALAAMVRFILIEYVGDVAVYVNANQLAKNFAARSQILDECTTALTCLLKEERCSDSAEAPTFDQVYVAGHSLGSVIAYDTISVLLDRARTAPTDPNQVQAADLDRLRGMVTFGSPLNKIFYFFREQIDPRQALRSQTLDLLHGYRVLSSLKQPAGEWKFERVTDPTWNYADYELDHNFRWINAYSIEDPVSGHLIFYDLKDDANQTSFNLYPPLIAHLSYWKDPEFYKFVRSRLF